MEKISPKVSADLRSELYSAIEGVLDGAEPTVEGLTVCLNADENIYATVKVTVHDNTKFSLEDKRAEFADKQAAAVARAADRAEKAAEKAAKAAEKAAKEAK